MENQVVPAVNVVKAIKEEAQRNEIFGAICYDFAHRERTRGALTVRGLMARMEKLGADFKRTDYETALSFLANLGLGKLATDTKGTITALKEIKVTLQSIGQASGSKVDRLSYFSPQKKYKRLISRTQPQEPRILKLKPHFEKQYTIQLIIRQGDTPMTFPGPIRLSAAQLGEFLMEFGNLSKKIEV